MPLRYASDLSPEEVFNEANKILAADRAKLGGTNYPFYKGQAISPMSSLTQKARALQSGFNAKPAPYAGKINQVLNRPNRGLNLQGQLYNLGSEQQAFNNNGLLRTLSKQFREAYEPRTNRFREKTNKDISKGLNEASPQFQDIGRSADALEQSSNRSFYKRLRNLQEQKQARRQGLVSSLEQFGAQKHGYNNLVNAANKNSFELEANAPFRKMDMLQESLNPLSRNLDPNVLPELQAQSGKDALQALRAYGIDTSKPVSEWENARIPSASYPGKLMADLPPEILASHSTLESMSPKFKGSQYAQQKALIQQMMNNQNIGERAMAAVPARLQGQISNLESEAQKRLKKDLAGINNQYIQSNQYGSPQHMKSAESRAREISKATLEQRNKMLQDAMKSELSFGHQQQQANLKQTGILGDQAQKEYESILNAIRSTNNIGATKFGNEQAENEDLYKNFQNEAGWEWPHLKGAISKEARQAALGDVFRGMDNRNISINNLAELNTNYSELQKEAQAANRNLETSNATIADLQRQLGVFRTQAQPQQAAEAQRQAQQRQQQAAQQAAQNAERDRLAALKAETQRNELAPYYNRGLLTPYMRAQAVRLAQLWGAPIKEEILASKENKNTAMNFLKNNNYQLRKIANPMFPSTVHKTPEGFVWLPTNYINVGANFGPIDPRQDNFTNIPQSVRDSHRQTWERAMANSVPARYINGQWQ